MKKTLKEILIIVIIIFGIGFLLVKIVSDTGKSALETLGDAYGTECEKSNSWKVGEYLIQEYDCLGWAGPHFRKFDLFENEKLVEDYVSMMDSCRVNFQKRNDLLVQFNLCSETITELRPQIKKLNLSDIDSIQIYSNSSRINYQLSLEQTKKFVNDWNKKHIKGYSEQPFDSAFSANPAYTSYYYHLRIFSNKSLKRYYGRDNIILDSLNWKYLIGDNSKIDYFRLELIK